MAPSCSTIRVDGDQPRSPVERRHNGEGSFRSPARRTMRTMTTARSARVRSAARVVLGGVLIIAGLGHMTFARKGFQAQVPDWVGIDKNVVVILSGLVEITLGSALIVVRGRRSLLGLAAGLFFIAVFPGNISQFIDGHDALGLHSDAARRNRLFFQPVLVAWAWWSTNAFAVLSHRRDISR
jgi:uncharacterized membrane protein